MDNSNFNKKSALEWIETIENLRAQEVDLYPKLKFWVHEVSPSHIIDIDSVILAQDTL